MYVVFARKYRPQTFEQVVGQQHVIAALQNAVSSDRVAHAYLFCGSRGVGKTTVARLLAKALNCKQGPTPQPCCECDACRRIAAGSDIDVMEIDGASTRGIDEVRKLRENVALAPARSRFKVYYIDEVHMLTGPAFNALLKTLEEPPPHVKFIFSTTDPLKLPETVRSRCQRFDFHRLSEAEIVGALQQICEREGLKVQDGCLEAIARAARGSMRDALGALDQLGALGDEIALQDVLAILGAVDRRLMAQMANVLAEQDTARALSLLDDALSTGIGVEDFGDQFAQYLRDLLVASYCGTDSAALMGGGVAPAASGLAEQRDLFTTEQLIYMIQLLREAALRARRESTGRLALELAIIRASQLSALVPVQEALEKLDAEPVIARAPAAQAPGPARNAAPSGPNKKGAGTLRRISEKLKASASGARVEPAASATLPEGMNRDEYLRLAASAQDPDVVEDALEDGPLMRAFLRADKELGLNPQRLRRRARADEEALLDQEE